MSRKLTGLRHNYGNAAADYFLVNPRCEDCGEDRIVVLTIHHLHGKKVDEFRTLCFNCHMLTHSKHKNYTYDDHVKHLEQKEAKKRIATGRQMRMVKMRDEGMSLRDIAKQMHISHIAVKNTLDKYSG